MIGLVTYILIMLICAISLIVIYKILGKPNKNIFLPVTLPYEFLTD